MRHMIGILSRILLFGVYHEIVSIHSLKEVRFLGDTFKNEGWGVAKISLGSPVYTILL